MLLHHDFHRHVATQPDTLAIISGARRVDYRTMAALAEAVASTLKARGIRRGDRVTLFLENDVEFVAGMLGVLKIGAVFMPVNPTTKGDKLAYMLGDARASALLTEQSLSGVWGPAVAESPSVATVLCVGLESAPALEATVLPWPAGGEGAAAPDAYMIDQDLAAIIYTSGSTGFPKGVMLTHLNMVSACRSVSTYLGLRQDDVIVSGLPLSFDYGLYQVLMAFRVGARVVIEPNFSFPVKVLKVMERERATVFPGVPTMFSMLMALKNLDQFDLAPLRMITNTAAALSEEHIRKLRAIFPQATLFSMYGLTECKRVTYLPPDQLDIRPTSVGKGMPNEEVWLVDDDGNRLPNGSTGELVIRGSNVMRGYWEKPEETAKRLRPGPLAGEMILYSGDLFRTDDEGWLYFVARRDDIIKTRAEKVSPKEVENAIYALEGVLEVAVIGVPDDVLGQAIKAFITLKPDAQITERDVIRHCLAHLENFMAPKYVEFVKELEKTGTGKIKKTGLA